MASSTGVLPGSDSPPLAPQSKDGGPTERSLKKLFLTVGGMTCSNCSQTIENALRETSGVSSATVSLLFNRAEVRYDPLLVTPQALVDMVEAVGFEAALAESIHRGEVLLFSESLLLDREAQRLSGDLLAQHGISAVSIRDEPKLSCSRIKIIYDPKSTGLRDIRNVFTRQSIALHHVQTDGDVGARKAAIESQRHAELMGWKRAFWQSLVFTIPVVVISMVLPNFPYADEILQYAVYKGVTLQTLLCFILATPVQFGVGWRFYRGAYSSIRHGSASMDVLVAMGSSAAYGYSVVMVALACTHREMHGEGFFETSAVVIAVVLLGRFLEHNAKSRTSEVLSILMSLQPESAMLVQGLSADESAQICAVISPSSARAGVTAKLVDLNQAGVTRVPQQFEVGNADSDDEDEHKTITVRVEPSFSSQTATVPPSSLLPSHARVERIDIQDVQFGDLLQVPPGAKLPVDGVVVAGSSHVDEAYITGEAMPVAKTIGSAVIGASKNVDGTLIMRATAIGSETVLSKIVKLVEDAQTNRAPVQAFADRVAHIFVPFVVTLSLATFLLWYILLRASVVPESWKQPGQGDFLFAFLFAIAVLLISCPCALGLATPTAVMVGTDVGARLGILFKGGEPLEATGKVDCVLFDKTGTLTQGSPAVEPNETVLMGSGLTVPVTAQRLWRFIYAVESCSEHLLAKAIREHAARCMAQDATPQLNEDGSVLTASEFKSVPGQGVSGKVSGRLVCLGNRKWLLANGVVWTAEVDAQLARIEERGHIGVAVAVDGDLAGVIGIADRIKPEARRAVLALRARGLQVYMVTGDNERTARFVAQQLGIPPQHVMSEVSPLGKAEFVQHLQLSTVDAVSPSQLRVSAASAPLPGGAAAGRTITRCVLFVGDGVNDSPALAKADVGVAVGATGTDIAVETASVVLMRHDLLDVVTAIDLSQRTYRRIQWNFLWAFIYNLCAMPIAAGMLYPLVHITLPPMLAAASMAMSSISVVLSSLWLKRYARPVLPDEATLEAQADLATAGHDASAAGRPSRLGFRLPIGRAGKGPRYQRVSAEDGDRDLFESSSPSTASKGRTNWLDRAPAADGDDDTADLEMDELDLSNDLGPHLERDVPDNAGLPSSQSVRSPQGLRQPVSEYVLPGEVFSVTANSDSDDA